MTMTKEFDWPFSWPKERYTWGEVIFVHQIGDIAVIEHEAENGENMFHPYIKGKDTCCGFESLDAAVLCAYGYGYDGPNSQFEKFARLMLKLDEKTALWWMNPAVIDEDWRNNDN